MKYRCGACAYASPKWMGFCPQCLNDGALVETADSTRPKRRTPAAGVVSLAESGAEKMVRAPVGIDEFDRVIGGGLVPGAGILLGGEPGVGKSTLLLQVAGSLADRGGTVLVVSAEESVGQVGLRASRLGISNDAILLSSERDVDAIIEAGRSVKPDLLVVDSIQTIAAREIGGAPGGVAQVRESAARLVHFSKESGVPVVLIGHVTKDGGIAGPKLVEHTVDVVLYLEGDPERGLRVLRGLKNRFGATHQVGLFEMGERGMIEVTDPAGLLASDRHGDVPGSVVFPAVDGRRPLLVEVQALVASTTTPQPRRSVKGLEPARVHQVIAVLERHAGLSFAGKDVYVSVVGGIKLRDPGADLPVALALASSLLGEPTGSLAAWGEVGLTGEVRAVAHGEHRAAEAKRLGLKKVIGPIGNGGDRILAALASAGLLGEGPHLER
ncbi:MAG: DNA repair protein RadA [Acidobacteria bacterium]|nr:DNA repair protein RadA [Acidobacteriota bacterium]